MRKLITLLIALLLLCLSSFAAADDNMGIYSLLVRQGSRTYSAGTAVLVDRSGATLLTAFSLPHTGKLYATGADGTLAVTGVTQGSETDGLSRLSLAKPSTLQPFTLSSAAPVTYTAMTTDQAIVSGQIGELTGENVQLQPALLPGGLLLTDNGSLTGITTGSCDAEQDRYPYLSGNDLFRLLTDMTYLCEDKPAVTAPPAVTASPAPEVTILPQPVIILRDFHVTVDISSFARPDEAWYMYLREENAPFCSKKAFHGESTLTIPAVPGCSYELYVSQTDGQWEDMQHAVRFTMPAASPATNSGIHTKETSFVMMTDGLPGDPVTGIPTARLADAAWMIILADVTETQAPCQALAVLTLPEGYHVYREYACTFAPGDDGSDTLILNLSSLFSRLTDALPGSTPAADSYTISFYLPGQLDLTMGFELTDP